MIVEVFFRGSRSLYKLGVSSRADGDSVMAVIIIAAVGPRSYSECCAKTGLLCSPYVMFNIPWRPLLRY